MHAKDVIRNVVEMSHSMLRSYVADLEDKDLLVRVVPGANHIAWQLGHMIAGTRGMIAGLGREAPELPKGFAEAHSKETAGSDDPLRFRTKAEYLEWFDRMKDASLAAIDATPDGALDDPGPERVRSFSPTVGTTLTLLGTHCMMHMGQFVPIRRKLGKGPLF